MAEHLNPPTEDSVLTRLDHLCNDYACGCLYHQAASTIRRMQGERWRTRQGSDRMTDRLHNLRAVAVQLKDYACHHPGCVARDLPAWEAHRCTCGLRDLLEQYRTVMYGGGK